MSQFPEPVATYLEATYGPTQAIEALGGLSGANVWRVRWTDHSLIVKMTTSRNEPAFYQAVAPRLRGCGVAIPDLDWSAAVAGMSWLILEDIPLPFPRERRLADREQIAMLRCLHQCALTAWPDLPDQYRPQWTNTMTDAALAWLGSSSDALLRPILTELQAAAQPLFAPTYLISGDPNPNNWGLRADGSLVLFDWERFSRATPALDLAITVPGLGEPEGMQLVAARYLGTHDAAAVAALVREITVAKAWTAVELFNFLGDPGPPPHEVVAHLCERFPLWLQQVAQPYA